MLTISHSPLPDLNQTAVQLKNLKTGAVLSVVEIVYLKWVKLVMIFLTPHLLHRIQSVLLHVVTETVVKPVYTKFRWARLHPPTLYRSFICKL